MLWVLDPLREKKSPPRAIFVPSGEIAMPRTFELPSGTIVGSPCAAVVPATATTKFGSSAPVRLTLAMLRRVWPATVWKAPPK